MESRSPSSNSCTVLISKPKQQHVLSPAKQSAALTPTARNYTYVYKLFITWIYIGSWNARSVSNKSATIQDYIVSERLDIFAVVETFHESIMSPFSRNYCFYSIYTSQI